VRYFRLPFGSQSCYFSWSSSHFSRLPPATPYGQALGDTSTCQRHARRVRSTVYHSQYSAIRDDYRVLPRSSSTDELRGPLRNVVLLHLGLSVGCRSQRTPTQRLRGRTSPPKPHIDGLHKSPSKDLYRTLPVASGSTAQHKFTYRIIGPCQC
jgi:hypothetical protein